PKSAYSARPRARLLASGGTRRGIGTGWGSASAKTGDSVLTYRTISRLSLAVSTSPKYGIALACRPLATTRARSSSLRGWGAGVDLYLKRPRVRSRGRGISEGAAGPLPWPSGP